MKLLLACTSGGHLSTMCRLKRFWGMHSRVWVTDLHFNSSNSLPTNEEVYYLPYQAPRDIFSLLWNIPKIVRIMIGEKPDMVISTGASIAIGFAILAKLFRKRFIYIESISRSTDISLTGKVVYLLADEFFVQNPNLCNKYTRVSFQGYVH